MCLEINGRVAVIDEMEATDELGVWTNDGRLLSINVEARFEFARRPPARLLPQASVWNWAEQWPDSPCGTLSWSSSSSGNGASSIDISENARESGRGTVGDRCGTISGGGISKYDVSGDIGGERVVSTGEGLAVSFCRHLDGRDQRESNVLMW